ANEFGGQLGQVADLSACKPIIHGNVLTFDVPALAQASAKGLDIWRRPRSAAKKKPDARNAPSSLRPGDDRCGNHCPGGNQEVPALNSFTCFHPCAASVAVDADTTPDARPSVGARAS